MRGAEPLLAERADAWLPCLGRHAQQAEGRHVEMGRARGKIAKAKGVCKVAGEVVSEAEVMFSVVEG